ncbi:rhamnosyltransferase [Leifsonia sp. AK011]|uniref:rhamnan synthesis F family protein n=1 Tax=Leifsonia sp. AK011 TaxID=2723075 RepID=UPI0015C75BAB|nr:rhamnan synthesis F family protein [Leifsonia sp. AK011]NYF09691.1 rhamnosyltransferase [Leifsonia sp. AK011]
MILSTSPTRVGIYFFYDEHGIVDDYVVTFLSDMRKSLTRLVVVVNGTLTPEGRRTFEELGADPVIVRRNEGFDVWAYKTGIDLLGWDELATYDELIMMNFTIMGPVGSFAPMFAEMDTRDIDFWGITIHNGVAFDPWGKMPDGTVDVHIQSHFIAVRNRMLTSPEFRNYWDTLVPIETYEDSIAKHEALFTPRFAGFGFTWDYYVDTSDLIGEAYYPLFNMPFDLASRRLSPIFKRKSFFAGPDLYLDENSNRPARDLLDFLSTSDDYDVDLVWRHVIRSANHYDVAMALNLFAVLDSATPAPAPSLRVGALLGVGSLVELESRIPFLDSLPAGAKLVLVHPSDAPGLEDAASALAGTRWADATVIVIDPQSAPWSVLDHYSGELDDVELVVVVETAQRGIFPYTNGVASDRNSIDGVLGTQDYVSRLIELFERQPRLGLVVPPRSLHDVNYGDYGHEWGEDYEAVRALLQELGLTTPLEPGKSPIAAADGKFWVRSAVLASSTYARARELAASTNEITKATPFVVQSLGYFSSFAMPDFLASNFMANSTHMIRRSNQRFGSGVGDRFSAFEFRLQARQLGWADQYGFAPSRAYLYVDTGKGFHQGNAIPIEARPLLGSQGIEFRFDVPPRTKAIRFDPLDGLGCVCIGTEAVTETGQVVPLHPINGGRRGRIDVFDTPDPSYIGYSWPRRATQLIITMENMTVLRPPFSGEFRRSPWAAAWYKVRRALGRLG